MELCTSLPIYQLFPLMKLSSHLSSSLWNGTTKCSLFSSLLHPLNPPLSFSFTFQSDTMQLFYPKGFKGSLLPEYKTPLPLELLMVAEKQKSQKHLSIKTSQAEFRCSSPELHPYSKGIASCLFPSSQLFLSSCCYWGQKARLRSRTHKHTLYRPVQGPCCLEDRL